MRSVRPRSAVCCASSSSRCMSIRKRSRLLRTTLIVTSSSTETRSQARAALKELHRLKDAGVDLVGAYTTLEVFLDRWYATLRPRPQGRYSQSTLKGYRDIIRLHLKPVLGRLTLLQLAQRGGAQHIQRLQDTLL